MGTTTIDASSRPFVSLEKLEKVIKQALKKTGVQKEMGLCSYLPYKGLQLSPSAYLKLKDTDRHTLYSLIKNNILSPPPYKLPHEEDPTLTELPYTGPSLERCIKDAMLKLNIQRETIICKYIPYDQGYIHHFTYFKMKNSNPIQLRNLIKEHILDRTPKRVPHKPRKKYHRQKDTDKDFSAEEACDEETRRLQETILEAMGRTDLALEREEDLCDYIPFRGQFLTLETYRDLKVSNPAKLAGLIKKYIIKPKRPQILDWAQGKQDQEERTCQPRRRRSKASIAPLEENAKLDQLLTMMKQLTQTVQDKNEELAVAKSLPSSKCAAFEKSIQIIQNELIIKILQRKPDNSLWELYSNYMEISRETFCFRARESGRHF